MENDVDPMDAIREIRREEGVPEDELPERVDIPSSEVLSQDETDTEKEKADDEELQNAKGEETPQTEETVDDKPAKEAAEGDEQAADDDTDQEKTDGEDASEEDKEAAAKETAGPVVRKFKANGQDFEFSDEEILDQFETVFGKAMDYTQKMQKIAPYRKMISALEQEGVTHDALNLALDALKGDKGAIKKMLEQNSIDAYDLTQQDEDAKAYVPGNYGKGETQLEIEEITSTISSDEEFKITSHVIDDQWDGQSRAHIAENPNLILGLHNDVKSGLYDKVAPAAMKLKVLDGNVKKSDIEYYMLAGQQLAQEMAAQEKTEEGQKTVDELNKDAQGADSKFDKASSEADRKRSASSTGTRADRKGVIDYLDDDDEAYDEWRKNLDSQI